VAGVEYLGMSAEGPELDDSGLIALADPEADAVPGDGAGDRRQQRPAKAQRPGADQRAGEEHGRTARNKGADDGNGLQKGRKADDRESPYRMAGKQMQEVDVGVLHRARSAVLD
jgi:hypothetical protein